MSKRFKMKLFLWIMTTVILLLFFLFFYLYQQGFFFPVIKLLGENHLQIEINETYEDEGVQIMDHFQDVSQDNTHRRYKNLHHIPPARPHPVSVIDRL